MTKQIFVNAAGFLRIPQDPDYKEPRARDMNVTDLPDPLDGTRIHPEDYDLARKMATDALELDEEDVAHQHPSHVVAQLMADEEGSKKLDELSLDDFAISLQEKTEDLKRSTLDLIHDELNHPFRELREDFPKLTPWEVLTMLTGETPKTLRAAREVSVIVARIKPNFAIVRLDSGLEGIINHLYLTESDQPQAADQLVQRGQTMAAVIIQANVDEAGVQIELTARQAAFARAKDYTKTPLDSYFDQDQIGKDRDVMERKKRSEVNRSRRVIQHPNFHDFNSGQAEQHLANMQRGEVVVRPSSKGQDHMAVTWKVDEGVYQHIGKSEVSLAVCSPSGC
jgi:transcription elongation factor SPT6